MATRPVRLRPTLNVKLDLDPPEIKRRRLGNGPGQGSGLNGNGSGGGTSTRSGNTGPRTRGMMELHLINDPDEARAPGDEGGENETERMRDSDATDSSSSPESSDSSDSDDSSDMDEEECDKKRAELHIGVSEIEKQFLYLKEMVYNEKAIHVDKKFEQVKAGTAVEFINHLSQLQTNMKIRVEVASALRDYRIENLEHVADAEHHSATQTLENDKAMFADSIKLAIEEKTNRLEQDRNNDFSSELWMGTVKRKISTNARDIFGEKKKKPAIVTGPYVVYMLHDVDIMEDWTAIKKAAVAPRRKPYAAESVLAY